MQHLLKRMMLLLLLLNTGIFRGLAAEDMVTLTIKCETCEGAFVSNEVYLFNKTISEKKRPQNGSAVFTVPRGEYQAIGLFRHYNGQIIGGGLDYRAYVFEENIDCTANCEISLDPSTATNRISIKSFLPNGEEARLPKYAIDDIEDPEFRTIDEGNCSSIYYWTYFSHKDYGIIGYISTEASLNIVSEWGNSDESLNNDIFVNSISDDYAFEQVRYITPQDENDSQRYLTLAYHVGSKPIEICNNQSNYKNIKCNFSEGPFDNPSPVPYGIYFTMIRDGIMNPSEVGYGGNDISLYNLMISPPNSNDESINPTLAFRFVYDSLDVPAPAMPLSSYTQYIYPFLTDPGMSVAFPIEVLAVRQDGKIQPFNPLPGYEPFSYRLSDVGMPYGSSSALLCMPIGYKYDLFDGFNRIDFSTEYLGQLGENRVGILSKQTLTINGEEQIIPKDNLAVWSDTCEEEPIGDIELTLVNSNLAQGVNTATIKFNTTRSDNCPPSPTMMMCKTKDGLITDTFKNSTDGEIWLSAADFICHTIPPEEWEFTHFWFEPTTPNVIEVSYAPHGEPAFTPLPIVELPEYFTSYGFGALYHAELKDITVESPTGWYDLRIYLEDGCGNSHEQTIEGAFNIETLSAGHNSLVNIDSDESCTRIFTLDGREIGSDRPLNKRTDLSSGVYIIKTGNSTEKILIP